MLFDSRFEKINLALPFVFMVAIALCFAGNFVPSSSQSDLLYGVAYYVFLNATHVGLSFLLFLLLPQARELVESALVQRRIWPSIFLIFALFLVLFSKVQTDPFYAENPIAKNFLVIANAALLALARQHMVGQIFGLSSLYNASAKPKPDADLVLLERLRFGERMLFKVLFVNTLLIQPLFLLAKLPHLIWIRGVNFAVALAILGLAWRMHRLCPSGKLLYLMRLPLWCFTVAFPLVDLSMRALHGIEYSFITHKMLAGANWYRNRARQVFFWGFTIGGYPLLFLLATKPYSIIPSEWVASVIAGVLCFVPFLEYMHYYLDSVVFRFRDRDVRRLVGPLLTA